MIRSRDLTDLTPKAAVDLDFDPDESPLPLFSGPGLELVQELAIEFDITVID